MLDLFVSTMALGLATQVPALANAQAMQTCDDFATESDWHPSEAYHWLDVLLDVSAHEVLRVGARPTVLSRQMAIVQTWLTPHWYRVETFGLESADQFRAPPPPVVDGD